MTTKLILSLVSAALVTFATADRVAAEPAGESIPLGGFEIEVEAGLLTIEARDAPVGEIVFAIGEQAGFETTMTDDTATPVSVSIAGLPVLEALERLLQGFDWVVGYEPLQPGTSDRDIATLLVFESTGEILENPVGADAAMDGSAIDDRTELPDDSERADSRARGRDMLRLVNTGATPEVLATLGRALQEDDDAWVRGRAAAALGALQDERAVSDLAWALGDENASVRMQAAQSLGQIGGDRAIWALGAALVNGTTSLERIQAAWALGKQDSDLARYLLETAAGDPSDLVYRSSLTPPTRANGGNAEDLADAERRGADSLR